MSEVKLDDILQPVSADSKQDVKTDDTVTPVEDTKQDTKDIKKTEPKKEEKKAEVKKEEKKNEAKTSKTDETKKPDKKEEKQVENKSQVKEEENKSAASVEVKSSTEKIERRPIEFPFMRNSAGPVAIYNNARLESTIGVERKFEVLSYSNGVAIVRFKKAKIGCIPCNEEVLRGWIV